MTKQSMTTLNDQDETKMMRLLILRKLLKLEVLGMRRARPSAYSTIKKEFQLKGDLARVYKQFAQLVTELTGVKEDRRNDEQKEE